MGDALERFRASFQAHLEERGQSQASAARGAQMRPSRLSEALRGNPTVGSLERIAEGAGLELELRLRPRGTE